MNIEAYGYTVVATVLGMMVVFLALTGLSLLMVGLKAAFGEKPAGKAGAGSGAGQPAPGKSGTEQAAGRRGGPVKGAGEAAGAPATEAERQAPPWLTAAVAAYLADGESEGPSAKPWLSDFNHYDPWLAPGRSAQSQGPGTRAR
ncbi:MAG: hypothetical protein JW820_10790 [Spirochaetales bacterium]|nr:hypothetical protein [Spirochaetales bacterium]